MFLHAAHSCGQTIKDVRIRYMKMKIYDPMFNNLVVKQGGSDLFAEKKLSRDKINPSECVTYAQIQQHFDLSYQKVFSYIKNIGIEPIGVITNAANENGQKSKGLLAFPVDTIGKIECLLSQLIDVDSLKKMAAQVKEELENDRNN